MKPVVVRCVTLLLIFLWVYTAAAKLAGFDANLSALSRSPFVESFALPLSIAVPVAELFVAALLVVPRSRQTGFVASLVLLVLFSVYIILVKLFASWQPCTCGGIIQSLTWNQHLLLNMFFITITAMAIRFSRTNALQSGICRKPVTE